MNRVIAALDRAWGYSPFMVRWVRLGYFAGVTGAVWIYLHERQTTSTGLGWLLIGIGLIYALAVLVMLVGTRYWTVRGLGLLGTLAGDAVAYTTLGGSVLGWYETPEWRIDLISALFLTGGALMLTGLLFWLWRTRFGTRDEPDGAVV
jgi:hypothetical protein